MDQTIAIVGGGISGLAAAFRIHNQLPQLQVRLFEASARMGGVLRTDQRQGFLVENAADSFLTTPDFAVSLCQQVGLSNQLTSTDPQFRRCFVLRNSQLLPIPEGFAVMAPGKLVPFLKTPILSVRGKLRAACEVLISRKPNQSDESVESFVVRRFGRELFERLVQPLVGGIYAGDTRRLSLSAVLPRFSEMERKHRSLLIAMAKMRKQQSDPHSSGARYGQFVTLRAGMSALVDAIQRRLPAEYFQANSPVVQLIPLEHDRWRLRIGGRSPGEMDVDGVVLALPARQIAELLQPLSIGAASELRQIEHSSSAVVSLGYRREQIQHPLDGFGFVVPLHEDRCILSCSFSSVKFPERAPVGHVLLRVFIGGECQRGLLALPREQLLQLAEHEVSDVLGIRGAPVFRDVVIHDRSTPQYNLGHADRISRIRQHMQRFPTLRLACNALGGLGVPSCVRAAYQASDDLLAYVSSAPRNVGSFSPSHALETS